MIVGQPLSVSASTSIFSPSSWTIEFANTVFCESFDPSGSGIEFSNSILDQTFCNVTQGFLRIVTFNVVINIYLYKRAGATKWTHDRFLARVDDNNTELERLSCCSVFFWVELVL
ncbi:hypothetical protein B9H04_14320 [Halorubrum ezzemoulense DSM 17463]|uniref:Uncharacterized protein n=1 Tax=Halorubrum ezzemoulense DSM 17463 TaxID=1121945 RepID=A0A1X4GB34_HALEZ|nr:hypothetical protein B9H04_14320 [Halorubrum ezzemoulense DSM 17463]